jgi:hypothetical protein
MKTVALLAIAFAFVSCASSDGIIDERLLDCGPGQAISIEAGLDSQFRLHEDGTEDRLDLIVEVSNNSNGDVTVKAIRAEQQHADDASYRFDSGYRKFDQVIEEGKDFTFHLPLSGRGVFRDPNVQRYGDRGLELVVTVILANGDSHRCLFVVGGAR